MVYIHILRYVCLILRVAQKFQNASDGGLNSRQVNYQFQNKFDYEIGPEVMGGTLHGLCLEKRQGMWRTISGIL
jgi:hypothetical protein